MAVQIQGRVDDNVVQDILGGGFKIFFDIFTPNRGEDGHIFFRCVGEKPPTRWNLCVCQKLGHTFLDLPHPSGWYPGEGLSFLCYT